MHSCCNFKFKVIDYKSKILINLLKIKLVQCVCVYNTICTVQLPNYILPFYFMLCNKSEINDYLYLCITSSKWLWCRWLIENGKRSTIYSISGFLFVDEWLYPSSCITQNCYLIVNTWTIEFLATFVTSYFTTI